ncbi:MAG: hypothetical protein KC457_37060, partial [Myxococcales bacterium]|nr:hypothetical protein [Myxococcales bacterium]
LGPDDYPCSAYDGQLTACDYTFAAGSTFPAAFDASNKRCELTGGHRYITADEEHLDEAFTCIANQGLRGKAHSVPASAIQMAIDPSLVGPGGCNEGFLRDDALLVATIISVNTSNLNQDGPDVWMEALYNAKHGDPDAFVVLGLIGDHFQPNALCGDAGDGSWLTPIQKFITQVPHGIWGSICAS